MSQMIWQASDSWLSIRASFSSLLSAAWMAAVTVRTSLKVEAVSATGMEYSWQIRGWVNTC